MKTNNTVINPCANLKQLGGQEDDSDSCLQAPGSCTSNMKVHPEILMKTKDRLNRLAERGSEIGGPKPHERAGERGLEDRRRWRRGSRGYQPDSARQEPNPQTLAGRVATFRRRGENTPITGYPEKLLKIRGRYRARCVQYTRFASTNGLRLRVAEARCDRRRGGRMVGRTEKTRNNPPKCEDMFLPWHQDAKAAKKTGVLRFAESRRTLSAMWRLRPLFSYHRFVTRIKGDSLCPIIIIAVISSRPRLWLRWEAPPR